MSERIGIIGAGSWGTALAISLAKTGKKRIRYGHVSEATCCKKFEKTRVNGTVFTSVDAKIPESVLELDSATWTRWSLISLYR